MSKLAITQFNARAASVTRRAFAVAIVASAAFIFAGVLTLWLAGCAVGKGVDGSAVVGFPVGSASPEGFTESAAAIGGTIGGIFAGPAGAAIGTTAAVALAGILSAIGIGRARTAAAKSSADADGERKARAAADAAWDESEARASQHAPRADLDRSRASNQATSDWRPSVGV